VKKGSLIMDVVSQYEKDGFVIMRNYLSPDLISQFRESVSDYIDFLLKKEGILLPAGDLMVEGFQILDDRRRSLEGAIDRVKELYEMVRRSDILGRVVHSAPVVELVKTLLGLRQDQMYFIKSQFCRMDNGKRKTHLLNWHQESFLAIPDTRSVQLWAPGLSRSCSETGTMCVLRGSAADGEVPHYLEPVSAYYITPGVPADKIPNYSNYTIDTVDLEPTDAVFFHPYLLHKSVESPIENMRYTFIANYINPYDPGFRLVDDEELSRYHQARCVNASEYADFLKERKSRGY
jgi:hypothetical protein